MAFKILMRKAANWYHDYDIIIWFSFLLLNCIATSDFRLDIWATWMYWMNDWWFTPRFCSVAAILGRRQPGRMRWMIGVLGHDSALLRLDWAGDNLCEWDEFCYESCTWHRIDRSACWPVVQRATTVPRMPPLHECINTCCYSKSIGTNRPL